MTAAVPALPASIDDTLALLEGARYVGDRPLATVLFLSLRMGRPLLLEGEAGVGKTEIAKVLAAALGRKLIRLQCYEGLDVASAVYEWNYAGQMMAIRLAEAGQRRTETAIACRTSLLGPLPRQAPAAAGAASRSTGGAPVLLIDELDRTDEAFEAFLLEILSDFQVTIPELGTVKAAEPPIVVITSNRTREIHDALKRRCLYHWIDYPDAERERRIVAAKAPHARRGADPRTRRLRPAPAPRRPVQVARHRRDARLGDGADRTRRRGARPRLVTDTLGVLLKYQDDIARMQRLADQGHHRRGEAEARSA